MRIVLFSLQMALMTAVAFMIVSSAVLIPKSAYANHCGIGIQHIPNNPNVPTFPLVTNIGPVSGPHIVNGPEVNTGVFVNAGESFNVTSTGEVDFGGAFLGGFAPRLSANGDECPTPDNYPTPNLLKNSLIVKVGGQWHQGGTNTIIKAIQNGTIILAANDNELGDNSRGWSVNVQKVQKQHFPPNITATVRDDLNNKMSLFRSIGPPENLPTFSKSINLDYTVSNMAQIDRQLEKVDSIVCVLKNGTSINEINNGAFKVVVEDTCRKKYDDLKLGAYIIEITAHDTTPAWGPTFREGWIIAEPDTWIISAEDGNGNEMVSVPSVSPLSEIAPPTSLSSSRPSAPPVPPERLPSTNSNSMTFEFKGLPTNIPGSSVDFECKPPALGAFVGCSTPFPINSLPNGTHNFEVNAVTNVGGISVAKDASPASFRWIIDTTPPNTSIFSVIDGNGATVTDGGSTSSHTIKIAFAGSDNVGIGDFECQIDNSKSTCRSPLTYINLAAGKHTFKAIAKDQAGNVDITPASMEWNVEVPLSPVR